MTLPAEVARLSDVLCHIDGLLEEAGCPMKTQMQIDIAVEEIFVNIVHYAYDSDVGNVTVDVEIAPQLVAITFIDSGIPYDPLSKPDPDTTLSAEKRQIGGLGIFMTKKLMDEVDYEYKDGHNVFTMKKICSLKNRS